MPHKYPGFAYYLRRARKICPWPLQPFIFGQHETYDACASERRQKAYWTNHALRLQKVLRPKLFSQGPICGITYETMLNFTAGIKTNGILP